MPTDSDHDRFAAALDNLDQADREAILARLPTLYDDLRARARDCLRRLPPGQSVAATELVHEAFLKLRDSQVVEDWRSDEHFVAAAAVAMRQIAIDRIRARCRAKRGGGRTPIELGECIATTERPEERLTLLVHDLLGQLQRQHPRSAQLVELRFFLGMTEIEAGTTLGISERTVRRDWTLARAWLGRALQERGYGELRLERGGEIRSWLAGPGDG